VAGKPPVAFLCIPREVPLAWAVESSVVVQFARSLTTKGTKVQ
jgi:hypothetical protein